MQGQLALVFVEEQVVPAPVWETLPPDARAKVRRSCCPVA